MSHLPSSGLAPTSSHDTALYEGQNRVLEELLSGMEEDARWVLLIGPEGSGKSTILKALPARLSSDADVVVCDGADVSRPDDLMRVLRNRRVLPESESTVRTAGGLADALVGSRQSRTIPLGLLIDNAHELSRDSVESLAEVVRRTSVESAGTAGVWVILAGRPTLEAVALRACGQLKYVHCSPAPLTVGEVAQHVDRRMRAGSNRPVWIGSDAVEEIARCTGGIPGRIDALCDLVARRPSVRLNNEVSAEAVAEVLEQAGDRRNFDPSGPSQRWRPDASVNRRPRIRRAAGLLLILALVAGGGLAFWYDVPMARTARLWVSALVFPSEPPQAATPPERPGSQRPSRREATASARSGPSVSPSTERRAATNQPGAATRPEGTPPAPRVSAAQIAALIEGARAGRPDDIARLLNSGVSADVRDAGGVSALMHAVQQGHVEAARLLLQNGAQVNARDRGGITSTMLAVINERSDALQLLLDRGADVNARSGSGWTALTFAAWKGHPELVRTLLQHGAKPNVVDKQGWTALDYATANLQFPSDLDANDGQARPRDAGRYAEVVPLLQGATRP